MSFDHPVLKLCDIGNIVDMYRKHFGDEHQTCYLFFDEVQYASDWDAWLKTMYDRHPNCRIMATGSASPAFSAKIGESGVGRWTRIHVPTLLFYEYVRLLRVPVPELAPNVKPTAPAGFDAKRIASLQAALSPLQSHFYDYLLVGGFPETALAGDVPLAQRLIREDVVDKVLKRDMVSLFGIRNVSELEKIFLYLCMTSGNLVQVESIAKEIGVSRPTVVSYLEFLELANLIYTSPPLASFGKKVLKARPKIYLADAAIRNAVLMTGREVFTDPAETGWIVETTVYKHLFAFHYRDRPMIGYFRDPKSQKEIDIVVSLPSGRIAVEVKYRDETGVSARDAIADWAKADRTIAILVTKRAEDFGKTDVAPDKALLRIPAFAFLYLLGHAEQQGLVEDAEKQAESEGPA